MHRPAPATVISLVALVFAMSGTAYAATGGDFILGKANTASSVSSLTNTKGTALSLSSSSTTPPLKVSNSVQVPKLNASKLGGQAASAFLGVNGTAANSTELGGQPASDYLGVKGTAANSSELGGQPASDYLTGTGQIAFETETIADGASVDMTLPSSVSNDYELQLFCGSGLVGPGIVATGATLQYWFSVPTGEISEVLTAGETVGFPEITTAETWVVQVAIGPTMATSYFSATVNTNDTCIFAAQTITNG